MLTWPLRMTSPSAHRRGEVLGTGAAPAARYNRHDCDVTALAMGGSSTTGDAITCDKDNDRKEQLQVSPATATHLLEQVVALRARVNLAAASCCSFLQLPFILTANVSSPWPKDLH